MQDKAALRSRVISLRASLSPEEHAGRSRAASALLLAHPLLRGARTVALYAALGAELDPSAAAAGLLALGARVVYPRIRPGDRRLAFAACAPETLQRGPKAAREPPASCPEVDGAELDAIVVPAVAFTADGHRLGRGGGYYDATLAAVPRARRLGLAFELQLVPAVPREPHDAVMDAVVTELRTLDPGNPR